MSDILQHRVVHRAGRESSLLFQVLWLGILGAFLLASNNRWPRFMLSLFFLVGAVSVEIGFLLTGRVWIDGPVPELLFLSLFFLLCAALPRLSSGLGPAR